MQHCQHEHSHHTIIAICMQCCLACHLVAVCQMAEFCRYPTSVFEAGFAFLEGLNQFVVWQYEGPTRRLEYHTWFTCPPTWDRKQLLCPIPSCPTLICLVLLDTVLHWVTCLLISTLPGLALCSTPSSQLLFRRIIQSGGEGHSCMQIYTRWPPQPLIFKA